MYFLGYLNLIKTIKRLKVRINVRRKRFKTSGKNIVKKNMYIIELPIIFLKKTAFTLKECSIKEARPNLDLSKYLFFLFA